MGKIIERYPLNGPVGAEGDEIRQRAAVAHDAIAAIALLASVVEGEAAGG